MFLEEAIWIKNILEKRNLREGQTFLELGSSNEKFRCLDQPFIDYYIFRPLRGIGMKIIHMDRFQDEGVDIVCDLSGPVADMIPAADVVLCANLLEHVTDRVGLIKNIKQWIKPGGISIVTVPQVYRYHSDPIDTMYRPTTSELENLFPESEFTKIECAIIEAEAEPVVIWTRKKKILRIGKGVLRKFHGRIHPEEPIIIKNKVSVLAVRKD